MFCPSNEKLQSLTEKTKLLAQKCTQQIRVHQQCISGQLRKDSLPLIASQKEKDSLATTTSSCSSVVGGSGGESNKPNFKCFCPCKGPLSFKVLSSSSRKNSNAGANKEPTAKWYVKVIQITNYIFHTFLIKILIIFFLYIKNW